MRLKKYVTVSGVLLLLCLVRYEGVDLVVVVDSLYFVHLFIYVSHYNGDGDCH